MSDLRELIDNIRKEEKETGEVLIERARRVVATGKVERDGVLYWWTEDGFDPTDPGEEIPEDAPRSRAEAHDRFLESKYPESI